MLYWEANRRLSRLRGFRADVTAYYAHARWDPWDQEFHEDQEAGETRRRINEQLAEATVSCHKVGVATTVFYSPPPAIGGAQGHIDIFVNLFRLPSFDLDDLRSAKEFGTKPTFQEWLDRRHGRRFIVHEFATVDARGIIPPDVLEEVTLGCVT